MEVAIKLAVETYSNLSGISEKIIMEKVLAKDSLVTEIVMKLMFATI